MPTVFNRSDRRHRTHVGPVNDSPLVVATPQCSPNGDIVRALGRTLLGRWRRSVVTAAVIGAMFVPLPLGVRCDCELQPEVRLSVAAPFSAVWRKSYVRPGDVVAAGQSLGLLDVAELQRELAAATAERDRAAKSADVNGAAGRTAAAQIDRLEVRRIDERRALLAERLANVEVKSQIAGVVLSGECDRAAGAPLRQGAVLYTTIAEAIEPCFTMRVDAEDEALHKIAAGRTAIVVVRVSWRAAMEDSWLRATTWLHGLDAGRPQTE